MALVLKVLDWSLNDKKVNDSTLREFIITAALSTIPKKFNISVGRIQNTPNSISCRYVKHSFIAITPRSTLDSLW